MKSMTYTITINAPKKAAWHALIDQDAFQKWAVPFSPNSSFEGEWKQGEKIRFIDKDRGGAIAHIDVFDPYKEIAATHVSALTPDMKETTEGEFTEKWIGTKEIYRFSESDGVTTLEVEMQTHPDFQEMFDDAWPKALEIIKSTAEGR